MVAARHDARPSHGTQSAGHPSYAAEMPAPSPRGATPAPPPPFPPFPPLPPLPPFPESGLTDGTVLVRLWEPAQDAEARLRLVRDPDQDRWGVPFGIPRPVDVVVMQNQLEGDRARALGGGPSSYAVVAAGTGDLLGDVACRLDIPPLGVADIGYATLPEARGRGVATSALRLLSDWLLAPGGAGLARVQLDHAVGNVASCRVAKRAGFDQEGLRRRYLPLVDPEAPEGWSRADVCLHGRVSDD